MTDREGLRRELRVRSADAEVPYEVWEDTSVVRVEIDGRRTGTCTLTVAGPHFGRVYAEELLRGGLGAGNGHGDHRSRRMVITQIG